MTFLQYETIFRNDVLTIWNYFPQWRYYNTILFYTLTFLQYHIILHTDVFATPCYS